MHYISGRCDHKDLRGHLEKSYKLREDFDPGRTEKKDR